MECSTIKFMLRECSLPPSGSFTVADQGSKYEDEYSFMAILMIVVAQAGSQRCHLYAPIDDDITKQLTRTKLSCCRVK